MKENTFMFLFSEFSCITVMSCDVDEKNKASLLWLIRLNMTEESSP